MASDKAATTVPSIVPNIGHVKTGNLLQGGTSRTFRPNLSSPLSDGLLPVLESGGIAGKADDELRVEDVNEVDDYIMFDDDGIPEQGDADDQDISETESEEGPDLSVLDLYLKLFKLRANPLGLARFSREERVQIELLQLLRDLKCPLKAFTLVLKWAAKSNGSGHSFREGFQPTREKVIANLFERYNMKGLIPKEKKLYLPYTQRTVSLIFFDASEVFASLLSCPTLNQDGNYFFDKAKDPFVAPQTSSHVGDIHTGRCYRKTYDALIKKPDVDMLLPCIMAMDKTYIDMAGRLQMEPITISHGLLNHSIRRLPIAMRILGYINHSTPAHLPSDSEIDAEFNAPADLPKGTARVEDPLRCPKDVSWSTLILNETHMQIQFILPFPIPPVHDHLFHSINATSIGRHRALSCFLAGEGRAMPVPTSQQPATEDGCRERALSNKDNQHAILAWTIYLLKSQRELSDGDVVMLQQTTKTRVLHESTLSSDCAFWCHHSPKVLTSSKIDVL
jgi:hypothetical protein